MTLRREFIAGILAAAIPGAAAESEWGSRILDIHFHPRRDSTVELDHLEGSGVSRAVLLPGGGSEDRAAGLVARYPDRFARFTNADVRTPEATAHIRSALKSGAIGVGELKYPSGRNALARDPDFARDFLARHKSKLMFGSDCPCRDGRGAGQPSQSPALQNKCVARETLGLLRQLAPPELFRRITWENGTTLLRLHA